jgi:hypothetical protein
MGDQEGEGQRADGSTPRGRVRSEHLFWTSPRIRSFTPVRPGSPSTSSDSDDPHRPGQPPAQDPSSGDDTAS